MKKIFCLFFLFFTLTATCQIIKGTIKDSYGNNIPQANVFFKKEKTSTVFQEFTLAKNGYFEYTLKKNTIVYL